MNPGHAKRLAAIVALLDRASPAPRPPCPCKCIVYHPRCSRCERVATAAEKRGDAVVPEVSLCETWISESGVRQFSAHCRECTDLEWSSRWDTRWTKATSEGAKSDLLDEVSAREKQGRSYLGVKRPGGGRAPPAPAAHVTACRCVHCREKAVAAAQASQDTSLFPPGYAP